MKIKMITPMLQLRKLETLKNEVLDLCNVAPGLLYAMRAGECDAQLICETGIFSAWTFLSTYCIFYATHLSCRNSNYTHTPNVFCSLCHATAEPSLMESFLSRRHLLCLQHLLLLKSLPQQPQWQLPHLLLCTPTRVLSTLYQH